MSRQYVQPEAETRSARGTYFCYALQAWIKDGVVTSVGNGKPGEYHGACPECH